MRWSRVGWLLPLALAAGLLAAPTLPGLLAAAREHQVRAYLSPLPPQPSDWRWAASQVVDVDAAIFAGPYLGGARR